MPHRIEILTEGGKPGTALRPVKVYNISDDLTTAELERVKTFLVDPVVDRVAIDAPVLQQIPGDSIVIERASKKGVTDPEGEQARSAIARTLGRDIGRVSFTHQYVLKPVNGEDFISLARRLGNPDVIHDFRSISAAQWDPKVGMGFSSSDVNLPKAVAFEYVSLPETDAELLQLSEQRHLSLSLAEMRKIKDLFADPEFLRERKRVGLSEVVSVATDAELEALGAAWSEHCMHKRLNARWFYTSEEKGDPSGLQPITDSLFKTIIKGATFRILDHRSDVLSVFEDNSGVVALNDDYVLCHKVETHNHPSTLDPFGGAATGTGGVIRDVVGTGITMEVVSSQFFFGTAYGCYTDLPPNMQSPEKVLEGIVAGVEDYGNKMGIATMCGSSRIDEGWLKPEVGVGSVGVAPREINGRPVHLKDVRPGYIAVSLGGRVGKDGIHGATMSSKDSKATESTPSVNQSVQIGDPITEKGVFDVTPILRDLDYIEASQDCGAGGFNSAGGELAALCHELQKARHEIKEEFSIFKIDRNTSPERRLTAASQIIGYTKASPVAELLRREVQSGEIFDIETNGKGGIVMDLTDVPVKYQGLTGWEKLISEAQERMIIVTKPENLEKILEICKHNDVEATPIAMFNNTGFYQVRDQERAIALLPIDFIHGGTPQLTIRAHWKKPEHPEPNIPIERDLTAKVLEFLGRPNMQSFNWIFERYDHEVQGGSLLKPIVGKGRGKAQAIAYNPILDQETVVIETQAGSHLQGDIDTYHMGVNNVVDAIGKIIASGGDLERIVFNGNTTCPNPESDPYVAAQVMRMLKGAADAEEVFRAPTISGKDSTSMQQTYTSTKTGQQVKVKARPDLLMSGIGIILDASTLTSPDFKRAGDRIYLIGETKDELGGSEYYRMHNAVGNNVPKSDLAQLSVRFAAVQKAIKAGIVHSAQYVGGQDFPLAAAIANCTIAGDLGAFINLSAAKGDLDRADKVLFSGTSGRYLVSVSQSDASEFERIMQGQYVKDIGFVKQGKDVALLYDGDRVFASTVEQMREANQGGIRL